MARLLTMVEFLREPDGTFFAPVHLGLDYFADGRPWSERDVDEEEASSTDLVMVKAMDCGGMVVDGGVMMDTLALSPLLWADRGAENGFRRTATPRPSPTVFMAAPYECSFLVFEREEVAGPWLKLLTAPLEAVESMTAGLQPSDALRLDETQVSRVMDWRRDRFQEARASVSGKLAGFREVRYGIRAGVPGFVRTGGDALAARWTSGLELGRDQARAGLRALEPRAIG